MVSVSFVSRGPSKILPGLTIKRQTLNLNTHLCICELFVNNGSISEAGGIEYSTQLADWDFSGIHDPG